MLETYFINEFRWDFRHTTKVVKKCGIFWYVYQIHHYPFLVQGRHVLVTVHRSTGCTTLTVAPVHCKEKSIAIISKRWKQQVTTNFSDLVSHQEKLYWQDTILFQNMSKPSRFTYDAPINWSLLITKYGNDEMIPGQYHCLCE